jgi:hypothetical protein
VPEAELLSLFAVVRWGNGLERMMLEAEADKAKVPPPTPPFHYSPPNLHQFYYSSHQIYTEFTTISPVSPRPIHAGPRREDVEQHGGQLGRQAHGAHREGERDGCRLLVPPCGRRAAR